MHQVVVADSSPLIAMVNIGSIDVLERLFDRVIVPTEVAIELTAPARPAPVRAWASALPAWVSVQTAARPLVHPGLHRGEAAAIGLALEVRAGLLLIDEAIGRRVATSNDLAITGTVGLLLIAADRGMIDLHDVFRRLKATDFWFPHARLDQLLAEFERRHSP